MRTRLDLLLAEHTMIVAKESAAAINHSDEYTAYTALLGVNTTDLAAWFGRAYGATAAIQFTQSWDALDGYLVDYGIQVASHDNDKANATTAALTGMFPTQFGQMVESSTGIPANGMHDLSYQQVLLDKTLIDDVSAQRYATFYADLDKAYMHTSQLGDALARHAVAQFPDRFPGDPSAHAVESRVTVNLLLQEHSYLATMATDASVAKRAAEQSAAVSALATNAKQIDKSWADWDAALLAYATGTKIEPAVFVDKLAYAVPKPAVQHLVEATIKVVDDQKATSWKSVANDDRAAATAMQPIADSLVQR